MLNSCKRDGNYNEFFNNYKKLIWAFYNYLRSESNETPKRRIYLQQIMTCYLKKPLIDPDNFKFFETVSEQHYYQLIRSFSYELEKKQSILIIFGFSFADYI